MTASCRGSPWASISPRVRPAGSQYLRAKGYDVQGNWQSLLYGEPERPAEDSLSGFLTTRFLEWLEHEEGGWFAHLSYLRPHPPYAAAGEFSTSYDPADVALPIAPVEAGERHPLHEVALIVDAGRGPHRRGRPSRAPRSVLRHDLRGRLSTGTNRAGSRRTRGVATTRWSSSRRTTVTNSATTASSKSWASSPRATTSSACGETLGRPADAPSPTSPRTSTSCRLWPTRSAWNSPCSATGAPSRHSSRART